MTTAQIDRIAHKAYLVYAASFTNPLDFPPYHDLDVITRIAWMNAAATILDTLWLQLPERPQHWEQLLLWLPGKWPPDNPVIAYWDNVREQFFAVALKKYVVAEHWAPIPPPPFVSLRTA